MGELCWWSRVDQSAPVMNNKCVMIIGVDVYHDKKTLDVGEQRFRQRRSIGAFVASIITPTGEFRTSCGVNVHKVPQKERHAIQAAPGLPATQNNALGKFIRRACTEHGVRPDYIVVYRDGVAHSQLDAAEKFEVVQARKAYPDAKLVYTIVQKRIHTRFLIDTGGGSMHNPPPGTIITDDLKLAGEKYVNFHLIPTTCTLSTVKPVHYVVLHNDDVPIGQLQQLTYTFCHLYPNWTNSIKLPFQTQAAHKMAYLLGDLKELDSPSIHQNLYRSYFYL